MILVVQGHIVPNFCDLKVPESPGKDQPTLLVADAGLNPMPRQKRGLGVSHSRSLPSSPRSPVRGRWPGAAWWPRAEF